MYASTERLLIDALRAEDAAVLFGYRADPRVSRYQGWQPRSPNDALDFINQAEGVVPDTPGSWYQRAIRLRDGGALVGDLGLHFATEAERTVELGISIAPAWQGRGLAGEALGAALGYLFDGLHKHRVVASVDPRNLACLKVLEKIGMRRRRISARACGWAMPGSMTRCSRCSRASGATIGRHLINAVKL